MPDIYTVFKSSLTAVANAIRAKSGQSGSLIFPSEFVSAISNLPTGDPPTGTKQISISENGTTTEDVANYANAEISVNVPTGVTPAGTKQITISANGTTTEDVTNYANAQIAVSVPVPTLESKSITENGTFTPASGKAWNSVTVNVPIPTPAVQSGTITGSGSTVMNIPVTGTVQNIFVYRTAAVADLTASSYYMFAGINGVAFGFRYSHSSASWGQYSPSTSQKPSYECTNGNVKLVTNSYVFDSGEYTWIAW